MTRARQHGRHGRHGATAADTPGWVSPLPDELAAESARTWDAATQAPAVPDELRPPASASVGERVSALHRRHLLRERRAQEFVADTMNARTGLPMADTRSVVRFIRGLLVAAAPPRRGRRRRQRARRRPPGCSSRGCSASSSTPRSPTSRRAAPTPPWPGPTRRRSSWPGWSSCRARSPSPRKISSTVFGQDLLATAREYIVRADPAAAARPGREREHRRPGHPRHPRRRHDEQSVRYGVPEADHRAA